MKILEIKNINKVYENGKVALSDINFTINKGEFVALLGHNGAGKSTLINILASVVNKTSGTVTLNNYDLEKDKLMFKSIIGIVPQEVNLDVFFTPIEILKIQQNLYGVATDLKYIDEILHSVGLQNQKHTPIRSMSGGMKRRMLIAKALVHKPEIVFLDEPTAGVDIELRVQMWDFLEKLNKSGTTIVLTTHYLEEAEHLCKRVAIIDGGKLITDMPIKDLLDSVGDKKLHLTFSNSQQVATAINVLPNATSQENTVVVGISETNSIANVLNVLHSNNLHPVGLETTKPTLEDVFLNKTHK